MLNFGLFFLGCKVVYYCEKQGCQKNAWLTYHREECAYLRKVAPNVPTHTVRLMARIILKLRNVEGRRQFDELPDWPEGQNQRYFDDLLSHQKEIVRDPERIEAFHAFYVILQKCLGEKLPPKSDVLDIYGRILINSFDITCNGYQSVGVGLYLGASVLDHSCDPNAVAVFKGREIIIRTISQIEAPEDVRISYTDVLDSTEKRRKNLAKQYYFDCTCPRCQDEESDCFKSSLICQSCQIGSVPAISGLCSKCNTPIEPSILQEHSKIKAELKLATKEPNEDLEHLENLFRKAAAIFHHRDKDYYDFLEHFYDVKIANEAYRDCLDLLRIILANQHDNDSPYSINKALTEMKAAKLCSYLNFLDEADVHLSKAKDNLRVTHGDIHPLASRDWRRLRQDIDMGRRELKDMSLLLNSKKMWAKSG